MYLFGLPIFITAFFFTQYIFLKKHEQATISGKCLIKSLPISIANPPPPPKKKKRRKFSILTIYL